MGPNFAEILPVLSAAGVRFIVVGAGAAIAHGSARATYDVDVVYSRDDDTIRRLAEALRPFRPYPRGAPPGLPFTWDERTVRAGLNFTLTTALGDLDLFGEVIGGGTYGDLLPDTVELDPFGTPCRFVTLEALIRLKRAAGRPKDFEAIAELEAIRDGGRRGERASD